MVPSYAGAVELPAADQVQQLRRRRQRRRPEPHRDPRPERDAGRPDLASVHGDEGSHRRILGPTLEPGSAGRRSRSGASTPPRSTRSTNSVLVNSEDGILYRWHLPSNTFTRAGPAQRRPRCSRTRRPRSAPTAASTHQQRDAAFGGAARLTRGCRIRPQHWCSDGAYGTSARNTNAAKITRCTAPCIMFVRPVTSVIEPHQERQREQHEVLRVEPEHQRHAEQHRRDRHRRNRQPDARQRRAERRLRLVCRRFGARGAHRRPGLGQQHEQRDRDADHGLRRARGGDRGFDRSATAPWPGPTTATSDDQQQAEARPAPARFDGGGACTSSFAASSGGRK